MAFSRCLLTVGQVSLTERGLNYDQKESIKGRGPSMVAVRTTKWSENHK